MLLRSVLIFLAATPAVAKCPVKDDLFAGGIEVRWDDDTVEVYRDIGGGLVQTESVYGDGYVSRLKLAKGVYVAELVDLNDGVLDLDSVVMYRYPMAAEDMPLPEANGQWRVHTTYTDTYESYKETQTHIWGAEQTVTYGDCTYAVIPGRLEYRSDHYNHDEGIHYVSELGIGLLTSYKDDEYPEPDIYTVTGIRALR